MPDLLSKLRILPGERRVRYFLFVVFGFVQVYNARERRGKRLAEEFFLDRNICAHVRTNFQLEGQVH